MKNNIDLIKSKKNDKKVLNEKKKYFEYSIFFFYNPTAMGFIFLPPTTPSP